MRDAGQRLPVIFSPALASLLVWFRQAFRCVQAGRISQGFSRSAPGQWPTWHVAVMPSPCLPHFPTLPHTPVHTSPHLRTAENPEEANLFYIPALAFFYVGNVRYPAPHMHSVVRYISSRYPYWNRTGGKDHFWWLTQDGGACALYEKPGNDALTDRPIKVVHFGLSGKGTAWRYSVDPEYGCLRPERDVVVPPVADYAIVKEGRTRERFRNATLRKGYDGDRKWLFFFGGRGACVCFLEGGMISVRKICLTR